MKGLRLMSYTEEEEWRGEEEVRAGHNYLAILIILVIFPLINISSILFITI